MCIYAYMCEYVHICIHVSIRAYMTAPEDCRDLKRVHIAKETYFYGKRDLYVWQKRPIHLAKETYKSGKRDLHKLGKTSEATQDRKHKIGNTR